jgi:hypothetical protein
VESPQSNGVLTELDEDLQRIARPLWSRPNKVEIKIKYNYSFLDRRQNNKNLESKPLSPDSYRDSNSK